MACILVPIMRISTFPAPQSSTYSCLLLLRRCCCRAQLTCQGTWHLSTNLTTAKGKASESLKQKHQYRKCLHLLLPHCSSGGSWFASFSFALRHTHMHQEVDAWHSSPCWRTEMLPCHFAARRKRGWSYCDNLETS